MSAGLDSFIAAAPWPQRAGLRLLLARAPMAKQLASSLLALGHYDQPAVARALGWDVDAVIARGRELRRSEGRP